MSLFNHFLKRRRSVKSSKLSGHVQIHTWRILLFLLIAAVAIPGTVTFVRAAVGIVATKTDAFIGGDGDGQADPGETIEYTVVVTNSGTVPVTDDATGVTFNDTIDVNTTLITSSITASPVAVNDSYSAMGNVSITIPAGSGVLVNDYLGLNSPATITAFNSTSAQNGQVTVNGDGSFTYNPRAGFEGVDTFTYTLSDNPNAPSALSNRQATVSITVSGMIWFINNNAAACTVSGCGRLSNPYSTLTAFNTANALSGGLDPDNNDNIFIYESVTAYSGGVTLRSGQKLIGQDASASFAAITGLTPPAGSAALPAMNSGNGTETSLASTVTLNTNATVRGLRIDSTTSTGMTDPAAAITGVSVSEVKVTTTTGTGVDFSGTAGSLNFIGLTTSGGRGANLVNNTGGTFTFSSVSVSSGANPGFTATGGGTVNVCDENPCNPAATGALVNTLTTTTNTALNVTNTTIGSNNLEFRSISSNGGSATGIILVNTGSTGALVVKGNGGTSRGGNGSGGMITNKTGGTDGDGTGASGVYINGGSATLRNMILTRFDNFGVYGLSVNNVTLQYSTVGAISGSSCADADGDIGTSSGAQDAAIAFGKSEPSGLNGFNSSGTALLDNLLVRCSIEHQIEIYQQSNSFSATVSNSDIKDNSTASGSDGILIETHTDGNAGTAAANGTITIQGNAFDDNKSQAAQAAANGDSVLDVTIDNNTVVRSSQGNEGFVLSNGTDGRLTAHITNNNISGLGGTSIFVGQTAGNANALAGGAVGLTAFIKGNTITTPINATNHALIAYLTSTVGQVSLANILIESNTIAQNSTTGTARPFLVDTPDANTTPSWTATVLNNNITFVDAGTGSSADVTARRGAGCFDVRNNTVAGPFGIRVRQASPATVQLEQGVSGSAVPATVLDDNHPPGTVTSVLGTITVVGNSTCLNPPLAMLPSNQPTDNDSAVQVAPESTTVNDATTVSPAMNPTNRFDTPLGDAVIVKQAAWVVPQAETVKVIPALFTDNPGGDSAKKFVPPSAPAKSGETVNITLGTLPAGKRVIIKFRVTVDTPLPLGTTRLLNQGTVSGSNFGAVTTTDPVPNGDAACSGTSPQTCTPVDRPDTSVVSLNRASGNPTRNASVTWQVVFANPVANLTASNFSLVQGGSVSGASITGVTETSGPPSTTWNITANTGTGDGTLGLNMVNDTGLSHDVTNLTFTGQVYTTDKTAPTVTNVTSSTADGFYNVPDVISIQIVFSEVVNVTGTPQLTLETGATDRVVNYSSGGGTNTLTFEYTVQAGDTAADLDYTGTTALALNGGIIEDAAQNNATLTLAAPGASRSLGFNKNIVIDTTAPTTTSFTRQTPATSPTNADTLIFRVTFSEQVTGVGAADFAVNGGTTATVTGISAVSPGGPFDVTVSGGNLAGFNGVVGLDFSGAMNITDPAGNPVANTEPATDETYTLDNTAPTVTINQAAGQTDPTNSSPINFTVVFSEAVSDFDDAADVNLSASTAPGTLSAVISGGPTTYNVAVSGMSGPGNVIASIPAGAAQDAAGNGNIASTSTDNTVTFDNTPPPAPVVITPANGGSTNNTQPLVSGTAEVNSTVTVFLDGVAAGTTTADAAGNWTFTPPSPLSNGSHTARARATDAVGNTSVDSNTNTFTVDTVAPETSIDPPTPTNPTNSTSASFTFHGNDGSGSGIASIECKLDSGSFTACATLTSQNYPGPLADGSHTFQVRASDNVGNADLTPASFTWVVDTTPPTATMTSTTTNPTNVSPIPVTVQFSEPVAGFDALLDVTPGNATVGNFVVVDSDTYTFDLTPLGQGAVTASIAPGSYSDAAGNFNTTTANFSRTFDSVSPTVTLTSAAPDPTNTSPIPVTVTFSESISGFTAADITPGNATVGNFAGSGSSYTFDLIPSGTGLVTADIAVGVATDASGNGNNAAAQFSRTFVGPEIALLGNNTLIPDGDTSPSPTDQTDFGSVGLGGAITHTFTISNSGNLNLTLSGSPLVALSGPAAGDFSVVANPVTPVISNTSTTFQVRFTPSLAGTRVATVTLANNDSDENPYTFVISGAGISNNTTIYLPLIFKNSVPAPDLVINSLTATSSGVTVVIRNQGNAPVVDAFWVDVYFNPASTPTLNKRWQDIAGHGQVWGVQGAGLSQLVPGGTLTLTTNDTFYFPDLSSPLPLPIGANVFALADSVDFSTTFGAVQESNEGNNLFGPVISTPGGPPTIEPAGSPALKGLPARE